MSNNKELPDFSFAFQPIVNIKTQTVHSFEALVRGMQGESAWSILQQIRPEQEAAFDLLSHQKALTLASTLGLKCHINLNMMPVSIENQGEQLLDQAVATAKLLNLDVSQLVLEVTENQMIRNLPLFLQQINRGKALGLYFAIDDFGAGYSGLNLLADFQPESVKLDIVLIRDIHRLGAKQAIVRGVLRTCQDLGIDVIAEGVESKDEAEWLSHEGIFLYQGYYYAKPSFAQLVYPQTPYGG